MARRWFAPLLAALCVAGLACAPARAAQDFIVVASTTSTEASGLFGYLLPLFSQAKGIQVRVVAQGTGQALDTARRGDADVVFVHNPAAEQKFVDEGFGVERQKVMYNDFVLVGPKADPAGVKGSDITTALGKLGDGEQPFISRGDRSGTHAAELRLWKAVGRDMSDHKPAGYKECGCGMGQALNIASSSNGYVLTDRASWLNFKNPGELAIVVEGDQRLFNQYGVIIVNPAKHPHIKAALGRQFAAWLVSSEGQSAIAAYKVNGQQLFFPNAGSR